MTTFSRTPQAIRTSRDKRMVIDCRSFDFSGTASVSTANSVLAWVMSFPQPNAMHVVLPSSIPQVRQLQCALQGLGCAVSRVTKCPLERL